MLGKVNAGLLEELNGVFRINIVVQGEAEVELPGGAVGGWVAVCVREAQTELDDLGWGRWVDGWMGLEEGGGVPAASAKLRPYMDDLGWGGGWVWGKGIWMDRWGRGQVMNTGIHR